MFKSYGKIVYNPVAGKAKNQWWMIIETPKDILDYYHHWILKEENIKLQKPLFGSHISVIRGEEPAEHKKDLWCKYDQEEIYFQYSNDIETDGQHWWLPITSKQLEEIRSELGFDKYPEHGYHLTLGRK